MAKGTHGGARKNAGVKNSFTEKELIFICENYPLYGGVAISRLLKVDPHRVHYIAVKNGLKMARPTTYKTFIAGSALKAEP